MRIRTLRVKRFLTLFTILAAIVASTSLNAQAATNPFTVGTVDNLLCDTKTPTLHLSIANNTIAPISYYGYQWTNPTLDVAYYEGNTLLPILKKAIPDIAPGTRTIMEIPVERADTSYKIAITATDTTGKTFSLLKVTTITPNDFCPPPPPVLNSIATQNPIAQQAQGNIDAGTRAKLLKETPTNVTFPKAQACFKLTAKMSCVSNTGTGLLVAWEYDYPDEVGFRIYRVDNGARTYVTSVSRSLNVYAAVLPAPKTGDFSGQCFAVVAVRNSAESNLSAPKCATSSDTLHDVIVAADKEISYCHYATAGIHSQLKSYGYAPTRLANITEDCNENYAANAVSVSPYHLGYVYDTNKGIQDSYENLFERFGAYFDLSKYAGHKVVSAVLELDVHSSLVDFANYSSGGCAQEVAAAGYDWVSSSSHSLDYANFTHALKFDGLVSGKAYSSSLKQTADVTSIVQPWLNSPAANHGLIVRNQDENLGAFEERSCYATLQNVSHLHLRYQ